MNELRIQEKNTKSLDDNLGRIKKLLHDFPSRTEGLNLTNIDNFFDQVRLPRRQFIVCYPEDRDVIEKIFANTDLLGSFFDSNTNGGGIAQLELAIIIRDREKEMRNGQHYTEGVIVHELAHLANTLTQVYPNVSQHDNRPAVYKMFGPFLEEGWADFIRGAYIKKNYREEQKKVIKNNNMTSYSQSSTIVIPTNYLFADNNGNINHLPSSLASAALEILMKLEPNLIYLMHNARFSEQHLEIFIERVNEITYGGYEYLKNIRYKESEFVDVYLQIKHLVETP